MKKVLAIFLVGIISFSLAGCGSKNEEIIIDDVVKDVQKANKNDNNDSLDHINLYSDDTKIVFNMEDIYYIVYYHNGNEITGLQYVYDYPDRETAKLFESTWRAAYEDDSNVEKVELKGSQFVITYKKIAYENQTLESVKESYSYLKELKKN